MYSGEPNKEQQNLISKMEMLIPSIGKKFHDATLAGMNVFELLERAQKSQVNVKFQGPTGGGKTTYCEAYCEHTKQPHFVSNMKGSTTSEELIGAFVPNEDPDGGPYIWKDGVIIRALKYSNLWLKVEVEQNEDGTFSFVGAPDNYALDVKNGEICKDDIIQNTNGKLIARAWPRCMLTIEEINFSPEELMSVWFSLLDIRRNIVLNEKDGEVIKAGKFLSINATMNPDYIGTNQLNQALNDRFLIKLNVNYDTKVENKIINEKAKLHDFYVTEVQFLKKFIHLIRKGNVEGSCNSNISTRMIEAYMDIKGNFGDDVAKESLFNAFGEEDANFVTESYNIAKSESNTVDLSQEEMEGLDLQNFKGYKPPKDEENKTSKKKATNKNKVDCPW